MVRKYYQLIVIFMTLFIIGEGYSRELSLSGKTFSVAPQKSGHYDAIGPFEISSPDGGSKIRLQFAGQLWFYFESRDNGPDVKRANELLMKARRIRFILAGTLYRPVFSYRLHLSTAPKSLELMDFYFNYEISRNMQFRFGQYKVPFTRYRIQSFQRLAFIDWAIVTKYFGAERQMGFSLHNGYERPPRWAYVFGVFTGVNARASHGIGLSKVYGEEILNPSDLADPGPATEFHPELFFHLNYNSENIKVQSSSDEERTGLRYSAGMSIAWDIDPVPYQDFRFRLAPELLIKHRGISFMTVPYIGFSKISNPAKLKSVMTGGLVQTSYRFNKNYEISIRYAIVDFRKDLLDDAFNRAQQLIAESNNNAAVIDQYEDVGQAYQEHELTLGFNIYIIGHALKWQHDASLFRHCILTGKRTDYAAHSQFQLTF